MSFRNSVLHAALAFTASAASAQSWPEKPVHLVVPYPPGGNVDSAARAIAPKLQEALGQPIIIEWTPVIKQANIKAD